MKLNDLVGEGVTWDTHFVPETMSLRDVAQFMVDTKSNALLVLDDAGTLVGIVSESDLVQIVAGDEGGAADQAVNTIMSRDVVSCKMSDDVGSVLMLMSSKNIRQMPAMDGGRFVAMVGIQQLTKAYDLLSVEANTDPLTGLSNRRSFIRRLDREVERAKRFDRPLTVAMLDLDHFKSINDTYGHDVGDTVLVSVANLLVADFRTIDLVGRLGGEEFALILPETDQEGAFMACERMRKRIEAQVFLGGEGTFHVTPSVGLASLSAHNSEGCEILKRADEILYEAKNSGRNRVCMDRVVHKIAAHEAARTPILF